MNKETEDNDYRDIKGVRREKQRTRVARNQPRKGRGRRQDGKIVVRSELRGQPDVRKISRAVIELALAQAKREATARASDADGSVSNHETRPSGEGVSS